MTEDTILTAPGIDADVSREVEDYRQRLLDWAVGKWIAEVSSVPLINIHRRVMDETWRMVIHRLGGDTNKLIGPPHDELVVANRQLGKDVGFSLEQSDD